jgi:Ferritin-like domain
MAAMEELARDPASRRRFLSRAGGTAAAGSFALFLAACGSSKKKTLTPGGSDPKTGAGAGTDRFGRGDIGIANFALMLEYIETDFYGQVVASGKLSGKLLDMAKRFGAQEAQHVQALEAFVHQNGGNPPGRPKTAFRLTDQATILQDAVMFENLGAGALLGQADRIVSRDLLALALSMHSVEGRHAAAVSVAAKVSPTPNGAFSVPTTAADVLNSIEPYLVTQ